MAAWEIRVLGSLGCIAGALDALAEGALPVWANITFAVGLLICAARFAFAELRP